MEDVMSGKIFPQQILDVVSDSPDLLSSAKKHCPENIKDRSVPEESMPISSNRLMLKEKTSKYKLDNQSGINRNNILTNLHTKREAKLNIPRYEPGVKISAPINKNEPAVKRAKSKRLKNWDNDHWAIPAVFVRCGLFNISSMRNQPDKSNDGPITIEGHSEPIISHTGALLRFSHLKVLLAILSCCAKNNSKKIEIVRRKLIKEAGIKTGGSSYTDTAEAIRCMQAIVITIGSGDHAGKTPQSFITEFSCTDQGTYVIEISDLVFALLNRLSADGKHSGYLVHINKEQHIAAGSGLAGWLHAFYSSHKHPFPFKIQRLIELSGGKFDPSNSKKNNSAALQKLQDIKFLKSWRIDSYGRVHVEKTAIDNKSISVN